MQRDDTIPDISPADWDRISGYVFGTLAPDTQREFEHQLTTNPALRITLDMVQLGLTVTEPAPDGTHAERAERRLGREMAKRGQALRWRRIRQVERSTKTFPLSWRRLLGYTGVGISAVALLLLGGRSLATRSSSHSDSLREYATAAGEHTRITFPDGSRADLAPFTRLRYREHGGTRRVELQGQALFSVRHDPARTFVVHTESVATTVLGTVFGIQHYPGDSTVQVAVAEGRVLAANAEKSLTLSAGMLARITDSTVIADKTGHIDAMTAWAQGELVFEAVPIPAMLESVGRWSGYRFRLADSLLARQRVTTVLPIGKPAAMLRAIQDLLEVNVIAQGDTILLQSRVQSRISPTPKMIPGKRSEPNVEFTRTEVGK